MPDSSFGLDAFADALCAGGLFEAGVPIAVSRAPGRLDVMGGIADYSGSLVLQRPIAEATFAAVQRTDRPLLEIVSLGRAPCAIPLEMLAPGGLAISYDEARTIQPGERVAAFDAPCGRVGLSICYDIRFPELYRALGDLALILMPAAFTVPTGTAHWELLLRARAVENQCYLLAAAQGGMHPNGRATYGHSMLVDPWGDILAEHASGPGVVIGDVDAARTAEVRRKLPAYAHRRLNAQREASTNSLS